MMSVIGKQEEEEEKKSYPNFTYHQVSASSLLNWISRLFVFSPLLKRRCILSQS